MLQLTEIGTTQLEFTELFKNVESAEFEDFKKSFDWNYKVLSFNLQQVAEGNTMGMIIPYYYLIVTIAGQWIIDENLQISKGQQRGHEFKINYFTGE